MPGRRIARALTGLALAGLTLAGLPAHAQGMIGSWRGVGLQVDSGVVQTTWDIRLTIRADITSRIDYPSLGCKGELRELSRRADMIEFEERITSGNCIDRGRLVVLLRADRLSWFWSKQGAGADASAVLYRDVGIS